MAGEPASVTFAGQQFWNQRLTRQENGILYHHLFAMKKNGYVLQFVITAMNDAGAKELEPAFQSSFKFQP